MDVATEKNSNLPTYEQLLEENRFLKHQVKDLSEDKNYLEEMVRHLRRQKFGASSEIYSPGQGTLFNEAEAFDKPCEEEEADRPSHKKNKRGRPVRKPLPASLPRVDKIIDLPDHEKFCSHSGQALIKIGEEVSEQLDVEPAKAFVVKTIRYKYACDCSICKDGHETPTMKTAPVELVPIPKSMATPGLLAYIIVSKYADALPLNRQETIFKRYGIELVRSTMANWMMQCGELVTPLINLIRDELLKALVIQADETPVQILKGTGKKATGNNYMWVFASDGPNGSKIILYELGPTRGHIVPMRVLEGYKGYLHTDDYEAYNAVGKKMPDITLVADWAHVRRKFDEALKAVSTKGKNEAKAKNGLELINELFRIEREIIGDQASALERLKIRREISLPVIQKLKTWADEVVPTVPPKTLTGKALRSLLKLWPKLILFLDDPILRMDTNPVENAIRPFVVGRGNWLFSASLRGAEASASLYSLIIMARSAGHNPFLYLKDVLAQLPKAETAQEIEALLPWRWQEQSK